MNIKGLIQPITINDALSALVDKSNVKILAGGTDLILSLRRKKVKADYLLDLSKIYELKAVIETEKEMILGSMVSFSDILSSEIISKHYNSLLLCAETMGSPQIRNMATIGGNIVNAGSAADIVPCLISLNASIKIESSNSVREVTCENYFKNYNTEKIKENELLTYITIPKSNSLSGFYKLAKRNSLGISRVNAALSIKVNNNIITDLKVSLGAVGRFPFRAYNLEASAIGKNVNYLYESKIYDILESLVAESIRGRSTMPFKKEAIKGVFKEALNSALLV